MQYKDVFLEVLSKCLEELTGLEFLLEYQGQDSKFISKKDITSQISIFGPEHEGMLIINIDKNDINLLYKKIENDELEEDGFLIEDFLGELTNIISGKFIEFLDIEITPSIPFIHFGKIEYSTMRKNNFDIINIRQKDGINFFVYIYLTELEKDF
ncbi:MAG TPA: chemotaxis protein CheX [Spirochaetota bacterium]|nr:chemotaxis protein CheX [Spirochaetota bacterium]HOM38082.1 chemotaxis protein CheX [Spirochaetota bacterium]HPQ48884.1 chemotaxis protein CheX [Spirochaetota bacterium]